MEQAQGNASSTPGQEYANAAYLACMQGRADVRQQMSAAGQIALLHGIKGELLDALTNLRDQIKAFVDREGEADFYIGKANAAIAKATGAAS